MPAVQVPGAGAGLPQPLDARPVPRVAAGPDHIVDAERERPGERDEGLRVGINELLHADAGRVGREDVLQGVVIGTGLEPDRVPAAPVVPGQHIGLHELQRVPQVRLGVHVRNRGGEVNGSGRHRNLQTGLRSPNANEAPAEQGLGIDHPHARQRPRERGIIS